MNRNYITGGLLFFLFFFAYYPIIYDLRDSVIGNELARHAPLVFALSAFLVYRKRESLARFLENPDLQGSPVFLGAGLLLNLSGQAAGIYYLSQISMPLTIYGMAVYLGGKRFSRELVFPLLFLLLAFPIPGKVYMEFVFPLKLLVTSASGAILHLIGYPVKVYGNILEISSMALGVVDACSGLNSLMAILTLSIFYSHLAVGNRMYRLIIVLSMLPMIIAANILRVTTTALIAVQWGPEAAEGKLHMAWGAAVFVLAVLGLMAVTKAFMTVEKRRALRVS